MAKTKCCKNDCPACEARLEKAETERDEAVRQLDVAIGGNRKLLDKIAALKERLATAPEIEGMKQRLAILDGTSCLEERAEGNGGCGICSVCCREATKRAEDAELRAADAEARLDLIQKFTK